jgi:hypothetical protein
MERILDKSVVVDEVLLSCSKEIFSATWNQCTSSFRWRCFFSCPISSLISHVNPSAVFRQKICMYFLSPVRSTYQAVSSFLIVLQQYLVKSSNHEALMMQLSSASCYLCLLGVNIHFGAVFSNASSCRRAFTRCLVKYFRLVPGRRL